ncbi:nucleotidyltransferase domain-containing protein [Massilia sp. P8910]|uniref:nucleotidyltransferase domain-containing protein n=1 Tax=Massilia antarctica TaxID=2765360 RepID=UPI001E570FAD|nr:nucleotidyltransferase domain-containing protein [Massilia antarctica]MCE3608097.1 nucleotidyltransferase domain-containing protein [Massilia antarctica]
MDSSFIYQGDSGLVPYGLMRNTNYPVTNKPKWLSPEGGLFYTYDSLAQPFWRVGGTDRLIAPSIPYSSPSLAELQTDALLGGMGDAASAIGSTIYGGIRTGVGVYFGEKASWDRSFAVSDKMRESMFNATPGSITKTLIDGTIENSFVGGLDAMKADRYDLAAGRITNTVASLGGAALTGQLTKTGWATGLNVPQGLTEKQFENFSEKLRYVMEKENIPVGETFIQGSRASGAAKPGISDIDILHIVSDQDFDALVARRLTETAGKSRNAIEKRAIEQQRIDGRGISHTLLSNIWEHAYPTLPGSDVTRIQFSIMKKTSPFNDGPFISVH